MTQDHKTNIIVFAALGFALGAGITTFISMLTKFIG